MTATLAPAFDPWPKTPRLFRDAVITEKIDGTNGAIIVTDTGDVFAQSRNRMLARPCDDHPTGTDNAGFRVWVDDNRSMLAKTLGPGRHYGEWWGKGIQRGYERTGKTFSLFNTGRHDDPRALRNAVPGLDVVPVLHIGTFDTQIVDYYLDELRVMGSSAAPGFMRPEGVCIYHVASRQVFKALIENDHLAKTQAVPTRPAPFPVATFAGALAALPDPLDGNPFADLARSGRRVA